LRISDIAADAGFADVTHFHRVFRERYGDTPAQVRRDAGVATPTVHGHHSRGRSQQSAEPSWPARTT
jgi:AraC-like DNA-binding protein